MSENNGSGGRHTLVEEGTQFKGSLSSNCPIVVRGRVEGDLSAPSLTVSPTGGVRGTVKVGELKSDGEIAGEFDADVVQLSGSVKDNTVLRAKSLEVKLASDGKMQVIFGECALEVGEAPTKEKEAPKAEATAPAGGKKGKNRESSMPPPPDAPPVV